MRWYWVPLRFASARKKSTLLLEREIVTFSTSSFATNSDGEGRKSATTRTSSIGPFVYLIRLLIDLFAFSPVSRPKDADHAISVRKPHR
jgi:hypothetical protein